jgi:NAD(P)-dependent dehydrogenase (short-subunit alcohol dehydrogenase family)
MKFDIPITIPRAALVTGGSRQRGIVDALTGAGFAVALQCHPGADEDQPGGTTPLEADLSDEAQAASLLGRAIAAVGPIGVLVNGASTIRPDTWDDATRATWDMNMETNLRAPFVLIQAFAKALPPSHEGVAINVLDQRLCPHLVSYTLSKAALWTLTQTMALALAPRVRVNGISHGGSAFGPADTGAGPDEIGQAALAILALSSMTGQMMVPGGTTPLAG